MFSSLPSASKIYVSSSKSKQKNLNSAKKKRKKITANTCTPVHVNDEETLVSSTSLRDISASRLSLNSHGETFEVEASHNSDNKFFVREENIQGKRNIESSLENYCTDLNEAEHSSNLNSLSVESTKCTRINIVEWELSDQGKGSETVSGLVSDSYNHECGGTDIQQTSEITEVLDVGGNAENSEEDCKLKSCTCKEKFDNNSCGCIQNSFPEEVTSSLPITHLASDDSAVFQLEESVSEVHENTENPSNLVIIPKVEEEIEQNHVPISMVISKEVNDASTEMDPIYASGNAELNCQENGTLSKNSSVDLNERKDYLGKNITSDLLDSSSIKSDCCPSTNIFDIHVDNSEQSSADENHASSGDDCRMQSPEQSEISCTESIMYDKVANHSESALLNASVLGEEVCDKYGVSNSMGKISVNEYNLPQSRFDASCSFTNLQKEKSAKCLKRSLSLPEKINTSRKAELFSNDVPQMTKALGVDRSVLDDSISESSRCCSTSDKSTLTTDKFTLMSNKSTNTSDIVKPSNCKKDVATTPVKENNFSVDENKSNALSLKNNTMLIMKVLPPVAIMQARSRSYVFGSIGTTGSLLGNEELSRFFPDNKVTVFVGTWNMNGHDPPESIDDFLLPLDVSSVPDICAIGVQESMQSRSEWEILLQTTLGPSHVLFASTSFGVLHLCVFMRRDLIWFCSEPEEANIATRPGSMIKTKGAVAICFMFFGTSFLFVNSHLTAHEQKLKERLSDYEKICSSLDLPKQIPLKSYQKGKDVTSRFDCVFWCGDLNFRVVQDRPSVLSFVEEKIRKPEPNCNSLMKHDQLSQAMAKGVAFHGFKEGVINFIPSYKFDVGTSSFDSTKLRVPSYTDRILYRSREKSSIVCMHYNAVPGIFTSDHKPVFAVFSVSIKPGRDNIPLAAGLFKREIYLEAIKRRAQQLEVSRNHKQSTICNIM